MAFPWPASGISLVAAKDPMALGQPGIDPLRPPVQVGLALVYIGLLEGSGDLVSGLATPKEPILTPSIPITITKLWAFLRLISKPGSSGAALAQNLLHGMGSGSYGPVRSRCHPVFPPKNVDCFPGVA